MKRRRENQHEFLFSPPLFAPLHVLLCVQSYISWTHQDIHTLYCCMCLPLVTG
jgi:hypothetical protein